MIKALENASPNSRLSKLLDSKAFLIFALILIIVVAFALMVIAFTTHGPKYIDDPYRL